MSTLQDLADARDEILKAELAALLHNLGKLSSAFIGQITKTDLSVADFKFQHITGIVADWYTNNISHLQPNDRNRVQVIATDAQKPVTYGFLDYNVHPTQHVRTWFQDPRIVLPSPLDDMTSGYALGQFIEFHKGWKPADTNSRLLLIYGFVPKAIHLIHIAHDAASGGEKQGVQSPIQQTHDLFGASAFGYEQCITLTDLDEQRNSLIAEVVQNLANCRNLLAVIEPALRSGLGDTQRPINDVTLWDLSFATAVLFKASVADAILTGIGYHPHDSWRLLHISFDGLAFWSHSHHVTDMLMRREALQKGLDAVRDLLEVEYPLGNEIYRDEHGSVFIVADYAKLLSLQDSNGMSLEVLLRNTFDSSVTRGELQPEIKVSDACSGKQIKLADVLTQRCPARHLDPEQASVWWADERPDNAPICPVCGVRPVGYPSQASQAEKPLGLHSWATQKKAEQRNVCRVCLDRRGRRAEDWAHNEDKAFERTIWIDEIADNNSRFALVVGRFVIDGWLDGRLIPTLLKSPSFARIQRCWETTRTFWKEVQHRLISDTLQQHQNTRWRLGIKPGNAAALSKEIGAYHTCELDVQGQRMGVCWDEHKELFWTTANLQYLAEQLGIERAIWQDQAQLIDTLKCDILKGTLPIYEPGGYLGQERRVPLAAEDCQVSDDCQFLPFIPLVTEPALFMALVTADVALDVVQAIKKKYDAEMARVRDRLPMHLGIVFAPRRTPMQTVFDAGRKMLKLPTPWEKWDVQKHTDRHVRFSHEDRQFEWCYPQHMGDGITEDKWYPHLLITDPTKESELTYQTHFEHVDNIQSGQTVYIRPSRFDFEFLDTAGRRFEINYTETGRRMSQPTRPFLLDDVDRLNTIWQYMRHLKRAQRHQVIYAIEATRELWCHNDTTCASWTDQTFRQFVKDTLAGAEWWQYPHHDVPHGQKQKKISWSQIGDDTTRALLIEAGVRGELADLAELHHQILKEDE